MRSGSQKRVCGMRARFFRECCFLLDSKLVNLHKTNANFVSNFVIITNWF